MLLCLLGGHSLQFSYQAGSGPLNVRVETSDKLNDDRWHSVVLERNRLVFHLNILYINEILISLYILYLNSEKKVELL